MSNVFASPHPLVAHKLIPPARQKYRTQEIPRTGARDRRAYWHTKRPPTSHMPRELETPLEKMTGAELKEKIGLVPILRAGLGWWKAYGS